MDIGELAVTGDFEPPPRNGLPHGFEALTAADVKAGRALEALTG